MTRKRFNEREVIETLLHQGVEIKCFRCKVPFFPVAHGDLGHANQLWNRHFVGYAEREHLVEIGLGGKDRPENCRYSCRDSHKIITNGTKATSAGSSKHRIAKTKRLANPKPSKHPMKSSGRKLQSKPFAKRVK